MKFLEKVKNMFTEEIEEEKPIKREVRHVEIPTPREEPVSIEPVEEEKKEEKLLFFDDKDFEDLEREEEKIVKPLPKKEEPLPYKGVKPTVTEEPKRVFTPSPIISPVYGVLDKNYHKEDIVTKKTSRPYRSSNVTIDDVRDRAFSTLEDDLKNEILEDDYLASKREVVEDDLDMFKDVEDTEIYNEDSIEIEEKDILEKESSMDDEFLDDTEYLAQKLEEQKRKLDEINSIINDSVDSKKTRNVDEYLFEEQEEQEEPTEEDEEVEVVEVEEPVEEVKEEQEEITEEIEETEEKPEEVEEVVEETIEEEKEEPKKEQPKSLEEAYKDAMDDIEIATTKTTEKKTKSKKKDMSDSELLNLIDSMYEKSDEDE